MKGSSSISAVLNPSINPQKSFTETTQAGSCGILACTRDFWGAVKMLTLRMGGGECDIGALCEPKTKLGEATRSRDKWLQ